MYSGLGFRGRLVPRVAELHITSRLLGSVKTGRTERGRGRKDGEGKGKREGRMVRGRGRKDGEGKGEGGWQEKGEKGW